MGGSKRAILALTVFVATSARADEKTFHFNTSDETVNSKACLEDWVPHGSPLWRCRNGMLQAYSLKAALKNPSHPFNDGDFSFEIARSVEHGTGGNGETTVWLRNSEDPKGGMQRIRVIVVERDDDTALVRIEEVRRSGNPTKLVDPLYIKNYRGRYTISLRGRDVTVRTEGKTIDAFTSVVGRGMVYVISSGGEGGWTDYDSFAINPLEKQAPTSKLVRIPDSDANFGCFAGWKGLRLEREGQIVTLRADNLRADYRWSGTEASSSARIDSAEFLQLRYAYGRDVLELTIRGTDLVGRCKASQPWHLVMGRVLP